jgi:hypothetical protein
MVPARYVPTALASDCESCHVIVVSAKIGVLNVKIGPPVVGFKPCIHAGVSPYTGFQAGAN